jgi:hypothetical protein
VSIYVLMLAAATQLTGCRSDTTFAIERREPAPVPLPGARTLAVTAFVGSLGEPLAAAVTRALGSAETFVLADARPGSKLGELAAKDDDAGLARAAREQDLDAIVTGRVTELDMSRVLEAPTLVTKRVNSQPKDVRTVRRLRTGRVSVQYRVVLADGRVVPGRPVEKDLRFERTEDPMPTLTTLEPKDMPRDPIPSDAELATRLVEDAAADIARDLVPKRAPVVVTWEEAGGADDDARELFAHREFAKAADELRSVVNEPRHDHHKQERAPDLSVHETAAALYDLGLCEDAIGEYVDADRHFDHSLTLENSERHLGTLRDLRRREESSRREERR